MRRRPWGWRRASSRNIHFDSLTALLMLMSKGCNRSVQFAGIMAMWMCSSFNIAKMVSVHWALKPSKMTNAGKSVGNPSWDRFCCM